MKRKWLFIGMLSALGTLVAHAEEGVTFYLNTGGKVSFAFSERPVVKLSGDELTISTDGSSDVSYAYDAIKKVMFESDIVTSVTAPATATDDAHVLFSVDQNQIKASGLQAGERVSLYALNGTLQQTTIASSDGTATLSLSTLSKGVYVVRAQGGISYKFVKH